MTAVYIETSIISYLAAWRSVDVITVGRQQTTRKWWDDERHKYELYISELVYREAAAGDPDAAKRRLDFLENIIQLRATDLARTLTKRLLSEIPLPPQAEADAAHIAMATVHGTDYLLTWNCRHIANASLRHRIETICRDIGLEPPIMCVPDELMEDREDV